MKMYFPFDKWGDFPAIIGDHHVSMPENSMFFNDCFAG